MWHPLATNVLHPITDPLMYDPCGTCTHCIQAVVPDSPGRCASACSDMPFNERRQMIWLQTGTLFLTTTLKHHRTTLAIIFCSKCPESCNVWDAQVGSATQQRPYPLLNNSGLYTWPQAQSLTRRAEPSPIKEWTISHLWIMAGGKMWPRLTMVSSTSKTEMGELGEVISRFTSKKSLRLEMSCSNQCLVPSEKKRKDSFRRQFNERPSIIPGCKMQTEGMSKVSQYRYACCGARPQ